MTSLLPFLVAFSLQQSPDSIIARAARAITPLTDSTSLHNAGFTPLSFGPVRDLTPVGVAYSQRIGGQMAAPTTFAGMPAMWHTHMFCRSVPGEGQVLADGLEDCTDRGGTPTRNQIAMIHSWTIPNPDGPFAHDNPALPFIAVGLKPPLHPTRDDRLFGAALGETYGAKLPEAHRIDHEAQVAGTISVLQSQRVALRELVPQLLEAERGGDKAKFEAVRKKTISTYNALLSAYRALASTPQIKSRLDVELAELVGDQAMKMP